MTEANQAVTIIPPLSSTPPPCNPALDNPAVMHCCLAHRRAYEIELERRGDKEGDIRYSHDAQYAYRRTLPPLTGYKNIRDFIACVAHGVLIQAIPERQGSTLLYAAQVALSTIPSDRRTLKTGSQEPPADCARKPRKRGGE